MDLIKNGWKIFVRFLIAALMCIVIFMSFNFVFSGMFSEVVGYEIYYFDEEVHKEKIVCKHDATNTPGADCVCQQYEEDHLNPRAISKLPKNRENIGLLLAQIFSFVTVTGILAGTVWDMGNKDIFNVKHDRIRENKLRGLYLGFIAAIPSIIIYLLLLLSHFKVFSPMFMIPFRTLNPHFNYVISAIYGSLSGDASLMSATQLLLCGALTLYLPITCMISYYFGYKDINLVEKLTFKKKVK